jgi:hypothetical protein
MIQLQIKSDIDDGATEIIKTAIAAEVKRLEIGLRKTNRQIKRFENTYKVSSQLFLKDLAAEDMKRGDREYVEWAGELEIREKILTDLKRLKEIEYVPR